MSRKAKHLKRISKNPHKLYDKNKVKRRRKKEAARLTVIQKIFLVIFIGIFCYSAYTLINWYIGTKKAESQYEELAQKVITKEIDEPADENGNKPQGIHFEELKNINEDIIGWIKIDNTTINYPIVQTTDNAFYLKKDIYKKNDACGSIFMDYKNNKNFTDKNNVLYGHHIKSGIMFADLVKIYKGELGTDININIYTPAMERVYKVFSSYESDPEDYAINTSITENQYDEFIDLLKNRSSIDYNIDPKQSSQILTLSTCDNTGRKRILVHAKLNEVYSLEPNDN